MSTETYIEKSQDKSGWMTTVIVIFAVLGPVVVAAGVYLVVVLVSAPSQPAIPRTKSQQESEEW